MRTQPKHRVTVRRPEAGFGMISLMVALVLLSVGVLSISQVLTQSVVMHTIIALRITALDVARSYMEEVKSRDPLTLASEAAVQVNDRGELDESGAFTREVQVISVGLHLDQISVIVTTPRTSPVTLVTWVYDGVY